jgi:hypothetical protein
MPSSIAATPVSCSLYCSGDCVEYEGARKNRKRETNEVHDDLAVRVRLEDGRLVLETLAKLTVVVDLTVDGEKELAVVGNEGLGTGVCKTRQRGSRKGQ